MPDSLTVDRRIRPPRELAAVLDALAASPGGLFDSKAEALLFAAAVAFHEGKRKPLDGTGEGIRVSVFENLRFGSLVMNVIAFAESGDGNVFKGENIDAYATVFEEYAHAGLEILKERVCDAPGSDADHVVAIIQRVQELPGSDEKELLKSFELGLD